MPQPAAATAGADSMCAGLDTLLGRGLTPPERRKALETRQSLHCPAPSAPLEPGAQQSAARP